MVHTCMCIYVYGGGHVHATSHIWSSKGRSVEHLLSFFFIHIPGLNSDHQAWAILLAQVVVLDLMELIQTRLKAH